MTRWALTAGLCSLALVAATGAWAAPSAETSLNNCQNAVKLATAQFISHKVTAIGTCLQAISTQLIKDDASDASRAAHTCAAQLRKINDSRGLNRQLSDQLATAIRKKCDPSQAGVTHTLGDILGAGAGVPQPLNAQNLNNWCSAYGGSGSIGSLQDWIDCLSAAAECDVDSALAAQYPRVLDWLNAVEPSMQALRPSAADPNQINDAITALHAVRAEIDGPDIDGVVSIQCGAVGTTSSGGGLPATLATGQTTWYGTGTDGDLQKGAAHSYTDNGDGTITDNETGLMWEKKDQSGGIHDMSNIYTWSEGSYGGDNIMDGTIATTFLAALNAGGGFAGHTDWRIPNLNELETIRNLQNVSPAVDTAFNTSCIASCTVLTCSCAASDFYWSASTYQSYPTLAWSVYFNVGSVGAPDKGGLNYVRAVRGGS